MRIEARSLAEQAIAAHLAGSAAPLPRAQKKAPPKRGFFCPEGD